MSGLSKQQQHVPALRDRDPPGSPCSHRCCLLCGCCVCSHQVGCHTFCLAGHGYRGRRQDTYECLACLDYSCSEWLCLLPAGRHASVVSSVHTLAGWPHGSCVLLSTDLGWVAPMTLQSTVTTQQLLRLRLLFVALLQASTMQLAGPRQETRLHQVNLGAGTQHQDSGVFQQHVQNPARQRRC